jgi:hypothetical protein
VTVQLSGSMDPLQLDALLQTLLWDKNITDSRGHAMDVFRVKVSGYSFMILLVIFHAGRCILREYDS